MRRESSKPRDAPAGRLRTTADLRSRFLGGIGDLRPEHLGHDDRDVIRPAAKIRDMDQRLHGFVGRKASQHGPDFGILHLAGKAVAAKQKRIAGLERMRAFQIDLHRDVGAERTGDDVFRNVIGQRIVQFLAGRLKFPNQAMIESELFEPISPQPIRTAIAHVRENRSFGQEDHRRGRGAHAFEVGTRRTAIVDLSRWNR